MDWKRSDRRHIDQKTMTKESRRKKIAPVLYLCAVLALASCMKMEDSRAETKGPGLWGTESLETKGVSPEGEGDNIQERFPAPSGFVRKEEKPGSFGEFVRNYPLFPEGSPVLLYNGEKRGIQTNHAAVFQMPLSNRDLQQCADSVMRMYGEYYWKTGQKDRIVFQFVNGFSCSYSKWREGCRVSVNGNQVQWVKKAAPDDSWKGFEQYMDTVFAYASTLSMQKESVPADIHDMEIGDVFLYSGSPGHVVMVADVCEKEETGEKAFLLAQGYMPAQQFHILKNPAHEDPWYYTKELQWPFVTPEFTFEEGAFRKMKY